MSSTVLSFQRVKPFPKNQSYKIRRKLFLRQWRFCFVVIVLNFTWGIKQLFIFNVFLFIVLQVFISNTKAFYTNGESYEAMSGTQHVDVKGCPVVQPPFNGTCFGLTISAPVSGEVKYIIIHLRDDGLPRNPGNYLGNLNDTKESFYFKKLTF